MTSTSSVSSEGKRPPSLRRPTKSCCSFTNEKGNPLRQSTTGVATTSNGNANLAPEKHPVGSIERKLRVLVRTNDRLFQVAEIVIEVVQVTAACDRTYDRKMLRPS